MRCRGAPVDLSRRATNRPRSRLLRQLIDAALRLAESFIFDQGLVDDAFEVGAVAAIAGAQYSLGDRADAHRLAGPAEDLLDHVRERLIVADAPAPAAPAGAVAADLRDPAVHGVQLSLQVGALLVELLQFGALPVKNGLQLGNVESDPRARTCHTRFLNSPGGRESYK